MSSSLVRTTLASAKALGDTSINLASATGALDGNYVLVDREWLKQRGDAVGTVLQVVSGQDGTAQVAHGAGTGVIMGLPQDFYALAPGEDLSIPFAPPTLQVTYNTAGAISIPTDLVNVNIGLVTGTAGAFTLALPTLQQEGVELTITALDAEAYTVTTPSNGINGADHIATWGGAIGNTARLRAVDLVWSLIFANGVTLS